MAKAKAPRSRFLAWFKLQAGPREYSGEFAGMPDSELQAAIDLGHRAEHELRCRQAWDERKQFAQYGWFASREPQS